MHLRVYKANLRVDFYSTDNSDDSQRRLLPRPIKNVKNRRNSFNKVHGKWKSDFVFNWVAAYGKFSDSIIQANLLFDL